MVRAASLVLALAAASSSETARVVKSLETAGRALKTMRADFVESRVTILLDETEESRGTVFLKVPGSLRWDYSAPDARVILIKRGRFERYFPKTRQVLKGEARGEADLLVGFGAGAKDLGKRYDVTLEPEENVGEIAAWVLALKPRKGKEGLFSGIRLWVDKRRSIPVQTRLTEPTGDHTTIRFENVVLNGPLPKDAFDLKLPRGVVEIK